MSGPIAVIGMACEFPGAHSPEELWQNLLAGRRFFRKAPPERLPRDYFDPDPDAPGKSYCDLMAVITDWAFDPVEFRIPPVTFQVTDIAHWLALHTAREAIRDAGLRLDTVNRARIGVVLGNSLTGEFSRSHNLRLRWPYVERSIRRALARNRAPDGPVDRLIDAVREAYEAPLPEITEDTLAGNMANTIAGRICNYFDLGGGGFTVDGACSSSLLSVTLACNALANDEMDFALVGGVDVSLDPFEVVGFAKTRALATDDIRPYDERATGMLTGEGCGIVVLAREEAARAAGQHIHALIRGWGYSSDGTASGITAPEVEGQVRALRAAYARAGYPIGTVGLIEGHGTGTSLGDKVELTAIRRLLEGSPGEGICRLGSIKANIGHCKAAAGIAGMIKTVMALERKVLPPTVNCERPSAAFGLPLGRLRPSLEGCAWEGGQTPRRASVSSMGFGGSNSHLTLEEADPRAEPSPADLALLGTSQSSELVVLAADSLPELEQRIQELLPVARRICRAELTDLSAALVNTRPCGSLRLALVAESPWALAQSLQLCSERLKEGATVAALAKVDTRVFSGSVREDPSFVALFPGQGSQRLNMGRHWLRRFPFVREFHDQVARLTDGPPSLRSLAECIFRDVLEGSEETRAGWEKHLRNTRLAQPAIVLTSLATLRVLEFLGLRPDFAIGHSLGEISALAAAGVCDPLAAVRLAALRGEAMSALPVGDFGGMAAVAAPAEAVQKLIEPLTPALVISNYNSPRQTVVSGNSDAIQQLARRCLERKLACRLLPVSHAFHSEIVAPAADRFREMIRAAERPGAERPKSKAGGSLLASAGSGALMISTVTGQPIPAEVDWPAYLAGQIRQPVRFADAVLKAAEQRPALWIEVGPGGVLSGFIRDIFRGVNEHGLPTDLADEDGFHLLNQVLARAWVLGFPVRLENLFAHRFHRPFDVKRYNPRLIVNPCERPVEIAGEAVVGLASLLSEDAVAPTARPGRSQRGGTGLDQGPAGGTATDAASLVGFAIEWIAKRTGFPKSTINPEKKLRDDLNLDSIKVGELVLLLTRKVGRHFEADPAWVANARITELVDAVFSKSGKPESDVAPVAPPKAPQNPVEGLEDWVRTFRMESAPAPLAQTPRDPLPPNGLCVIVADDRAPRAQAISERLRGCGLAPQIIAPESLEESGGAPSDLRVVILLLPETTSSFLACTPAEFDQRVEGLGTTLFRVFRWAGHGTDSTKLRGLVVRPSADTDDPALDLDGGSGFLKSLGLEYPEANFKWLALPAAWRPERWAEVVSEELQTARDRVAFAYTADGRRMAMMAQAAPQEASSEKLLGSEDVVLVSGGAKGITCELALELARATGVKLALLGSSPRPVGTAEPGGDELQRNLKRLQELGIRHCYFQADVTDLEAVRSAVAEAERTLGPVTAILHGAGVTELRLFREKDLRTFLRCIRIKARGLFNLLAAVPPGRLKALHVISSVLGHTGMRGQADYALANAWLDGAVCAVQAAHPRARVLSLGFTAWAETGLARKVGAVNSLRTVGVTPLRTEQGTAAYLALVRCPRASGRFVITGRLGGELDSVLFAPAEKPQGRFLEQIRRQVPGVEMVAEAVLSHESDLYLPEHVFDGTPVFPGVMAMEAMVQAAQACVRRNDLPVLRAVEFRRPLIVPESAKVVVRTLALADPPTNATVRVRVAIRSDRDAFKENHFEAECWFGEPEQTGVTAGNLPDPLPAPLERDPEDFSPVPLFQGKFFRRISAIRRWAMEQESLTEIQVPTGERYYSPVFSQIPVTPSPAVQDACLQSGALILPPGCLPSRIEERRFHGRATAGSVHCATFVRERSADEFVVDIATFGPNGQPLETLRGLRLKRSSASLSPRRASGPLARTRLQGDLQALLPGRPHAVVLVDHGELREAHGVPEISTEEAERLSRETPDARRPSVLANLVAARRAALAFARQHCGLDLSPKQVTLIHRADGKPELRCEQPFQPAGSPGEGAPKPMDVSLADCSGWSVALVGRAPVGVDLELVERRDSETWRGLLGDDGYALALHAAAQTGERFDLAATRVWTLLEAAKKANGLRRLVPGFESAVGGPWISLTGTMGSTELEFLSATVDLAGEPRATAALALAFGGSVETRPDAASGLVRSDARAADPLGSVLASFRSDMERLKVACANDPEAPGCRDRHAEFIEAIERTSAQLKALERNQGTDELAAMRGRFQQEVQAFLDGSDNFRHTLAKPLGYAGDYRLIEMLVNDACTSRGLAWHFDRSQLDYPASRACRGRIEWISDELAARLDRKGQQQISILDLGIGAASVEQRLIRAQPGATLALHAVDLEPAALDHVARLFGPRGHRVYPWRLNLRDAPAVSKLNELAAQVDACIAIGILEALTNQEADRVLRAVLEGLPAGSVLYTENFIPGHPTRSIMEWFQDFHLAYRSPEELRSLALQAGADAARIDLKLDSTGSLALLKVVK